MTLYEADDRLGGHADTHDVQVGDRTVAVDTGFIVHNERTYPTLLRLFAELGIATQESDMSMSVRDAETGLEWAGALGASGLFPSRANLRNPRYLRMLTEIPRFHRMAKKLLASPEVSTLRQAQEGPGSTTEVDETLAQFLERGRFTDFFVTYFMTPLVSAVWSTDPDHALDYPARYLFRFLEHHGMLTVFGSPTWRTVTGGSREYVERVAKNLHEVRLSSPVSEIREHEHGVDVTDPSGTATYDAVVVATHPDQALAMLAEPTPLHREVLGAIHYQPNVAQLHTDERLLPRAEGARASWNYQRRDDGRVLVTYDMTRLQRLDLDRLDHREAPARFLVSLGAEDVVDPSTVIATMRYAHPVYTPASVAAQARLPQLNTSRVAFAGAYHGWGFHEDGALSGRRAAEALGGRWTSAGERPRLAPTPRIYATEIKHARVEPVRNVFSYRSHTWLVDLDDLPRYTGGLRAAAAPTWRRSRPATTSATPTAACARTSTASSRSMTSTCRADASRCSRTRAPSATSSTRSPCSGATGPTTSSRRSWSRCTTPTAGVTPTSCDPTSTAGRASTRSSTSRRSTTPPAAYHVAVPLPGETVTVGVTLHREGRPPFTATLKGTARPATPRAVVSTSLRTPLAPLLGMVRIKYQGIKLWLRGLEVQPRPNHRGDTR